MISVFRGWPRKIPGSYTFVAETLKPLKPMIFHRKANSVILVNVFLSIGKAKAVFR